MNRLPRTSGIRDKGTRLAFLAGFATLALTALAGDLAAQERIVETRPATPATIIHIGTVPRSVRVIGWNENQVRVDVVVDDRVETFDIRGDERALRIDLQPRPGTSGRSRATGGLEVRVPAGGRVHVHTISGSIDAEEVRGEVDLNTVSGRIRVSGALRTVDAESVSGAVDIQASADRIRASSTSGAVNITGPVDQVRASSTSGAVVIRQAGGFVDAHTVSGRVEVNAVNAIREAILGSTSGGIEFRGPLSNDAILEAHNHSGPIVLDLPAAINAAFNINTFSGGIRSAFDHPEPPRTRGPGQQLTFVVGTGTGRVSAQTFSGSVRLDRH